MVVHAMPKCCCGGVLLGKPRKVDSPKKEVVEKPQDGLQKSSRNIENPYQMEDNKNPKGAAREARRPLGAAPKAPPCCLPFGKDFLCFRCISGAEPGTETGDFTKTLKPGMKPETETGLPQ